MSTDRDRLGWVEADVRRLVARLDEAEGLVRSAECQASARAKDVRREIKDARDEIEEISRATSAEVGELRRDTVRGVTILSGRLDAHTLALLALAVVSLVEAVAIGLLWWFR